MTKNCSTCICKEGACYPSTTIFDKDKTCKSYMPDYEGYIADLEKENEELKERLAEVNLNGNIVLRELTKAKEIIKDLMSFSVQLCDCRHTVDFEKTREQAEQFLKEIEK